MLKRRNSGAKLLTVALFLSVLHHADHILRIDHSGWPFIPPTSPFTYSLVVYPVFISVFLNLGKPLYCAVVTALLFAFATLSHIFFEPLSDKFHTWAYGSNLPGHVDEKNLLGIRSAVIGIVSVSIAVLLSVALLLALIAFVNEIRMRRNTK